jgi:PAS domain S-box-containing protein
MPVKPAFVRYRSLVSLAAFATLVALFVVDIAFDVRFNASILYPTVMLACFAMRDRRLLWFLCTFAVFLTLAALGFEENDARSVGHRVAMAASLIATGVIVHFLIRAWDDLDAHSESLSANNAELAAREEEIARQNEELQSQTEELERQSEELRVANEELARRERALAVLLELSRGLSIELTRSETLDRVCSTLATLLNGPDTATAVLERRGNVMKVVCRHGFGTDGVVGDEIPLDSSFASLVFSHGRTGFIEDLSLRPDLRVPQPKDGQQPIVSVISTPLYVNGEPVGAIEAYSRYRRAWTAEQVALVESLASQTATALRSESLFEEVERQRQHFETIFRTVPVGMSLLLKDDRGIRMNPAGAALLGLPPETDIGEDEFFRSVRVFRDGTEIKSFEHGRAAAETSSAMTNEMEIVLRSGKRMSVLYSVAPLKAGGDAVAVSAFVDVTPMKELQRELDVRRREAEEASVRKTRFLAAVSHDVRTPANAISLLAELIRRTAHMPAATVRSPRWPRNCIPARWRS